MSINHNATQLADLEYIDAMNAISEQSIGTDTDGAIAILGYLNLGINVLYLVMFIATVIGLYKLSKKLGDKHSWLAFIPLIQTYTYIKTAGYSFWKGLLLLIAYGILAWVFISILLIGFIALTDSVFSSMSSIATAIAGVIAVIVLTLLALLISTLFLYKGMAQRAGQSTGTAVLMALFPWCMLWIVANRIPQKIASTPVSAPVASGGTSTEG